MLRGKFLQVFEPQNRVAIEANTTYYWRMRSILGVNESDWTEPKSFTTDDLERPTAQSVSTNEDVPVSITLAGSDPDGDSLVMS